MKLSEVLDKYYVLPLNQSEIVGYHIVLGEILITWVDSETLKEHQQYFLDQEVVPAPVIKGAFIVDRINGEGSVSFIALDGVELPT